MPQVDLMNIMKPYIEADIGKHLTLNLNKMVHSGLDQLLDRADRGVS